MLELAKHFLFSFWGILYKLLHLLKIFCSMVFLSFSWFNCQLKRGSLQPPLSVGTSSVTFFWGSLFPSSTCLRHITIMFFEKNDPYLFPPNQGLLLHSNVKNLLGSKHCSVQALGYSNGQNRLKLPALLVSIFWRENNKQMEENQCMIYQESKKDV